MYIGYTEIKIGICLIALMSLSMYIGYRYLINHSGYYESVVDDVLHNLEKDGIIELVEENGELEIYSGYKHDPKTTS